MRKKTKKKVLIDLPSIGGKAVLKKYGPEHFSKMASKGWRNRRKKEREAKKALKNNEL